jgi:hypothetical protein
MMSDDAAVGSLQGRPGMVGIVTREVPPFHKRSTVAATGEIESADEAGGGSRLGSNAATRRSPLLLGVGKSSSEEDIPLLARR